MLAIINFNLTVLELVGPISRVILTFNGQICARITCGVKGSLSSPEVR